MTDDNVLVVYKTVDELISAMEGSKYNDMDVYTYTIIYFCETLLSILESKTNVPSGHDISIITYIHKFGINHRPKNQILEIYKNRKESL